MGNFYDVLNIQAARQQLSEQMEQMKGNLPKNTVPYVGR
jgi:Cu/Ag efflux pump CusA